MEGSKKVTQKEAIKQFLRSMGCWVSAYDLRGRKTIFGFLGHQADRRARELASSGEIQKRYVHRGGVLIVQYKMSESEA